MKKLLPMLLMALALVSCKDNAYKITVTMPDDSTDGQTVYLTSYDSGDTVQQATVQNKTCVLEGTADKSYYARLLFNGGRHGFIVEPGEYTLNLGDDKATSPLNVKLQQVQERMEAVANDTTIPEAQTDAAFAEIAKQAYEENRDNGIGPWAFYQYLMYNNFTEQQLDSVLALAPADYRNLKRNQKAVSDAHQLTVTAVGQPFTDFAVKGEDGNVTKLSDFVGKGKPVLLDFWASWCPPCRAEMPKLKALKDKYGDKLQVVSVAVWDAPEASRKAVDELGMTWNVVIGDKNLTEPTDLYGVKGIPTLVLFDADGVIAGRDFRSEPLADKIAELAR